MRYECGNIVISVEQIDGFGKNPGLWVGTKDPNTLTKVASFGSEDKSKLFCKWLEQMVLLTKEGEDANER